ncbi:11543_t:CDS:1, partial [Racocetra persica]
MDDWPLLNFMHKLQNPVPQFVLGCLPAIAIIGASPEKGFKKKFLWMLRCLACPFTGLFYTFIIENKETSIFAYWLPSERFITDNNGKVRNIPFGYHYKAISNLTKTQKECIKECIAEASILERLSPLVSAYYIIISLLSGIARVFSPGACTDWPYISVLLAWTIVVVYKRSICGKILVKSPEDMLQEYVNNKKLVLDEHIYVKDLNEKDLKLRRTLIIIIGLVSIIFPWLSVFMAYNTPPVGFFCRSSYLTVICSIWTLNSAIAFICHIKGEKKANNENIIHTMYCFW